MGSIWSKARGAALLVAFAVLAIAAASALAGVTVYKNDFSSRGESKELRHVDGKHCHKRWRKKTRNLRIDVTKGPSLCGYRPPVEGDKPGPDLDLTVTGKLRKATPKGLRDGTFFVLAVRKGKSTGYELRVFPSKHMFQLLRKPSGGGSDFPAKGRKHAIKGVNRANVLRLSAVGDKVIARANGKKLAAVTDSNAAEVSGRTLEVGVGDKRSTGKTASGTVDDVKVQVPKP